MMQRPPKRVLLADNDPDYRKSLSGLLVLEGYLVEEAGSPTEALEKLARDRFDLVLADLRLQDDSDLNDISGMEVAKRASGLGISCIIVTAFPTVELARLALRSRGEEPFAEDLITKTSGPQALLDSINITLSNSADHRRGNTMPARLTIDFDRKLVWKDGVLVDLSKYQYILLEELFRKDGGVCSHAELIKAIYGEVVSDADAVNDRRLRNLVDRTKEKIEDPGSDHEYIAAVTGRGYRLNLDP
ncbi:MAG TPA: response regulator transcription factor [Anaerolineales bacterium]|nr:response regulator transcription factor [Anaerolineales bacterium]